MTKITLASTSPRRKDLLSLIVPKFETCAPDYEEDMTLKLSPRKLVKHLAEGKCKAAVLVVGEGVVISADTIVACGNKVYGKPKSKRDLQRMLREQSGKVVSVLTGLAVYDNNSKKLISKVVEAKLHFRKLSKQEIDRYLKFDDGIDKAGGWALQGRGAAFFTKIVGDYSAIVGLPIAEVIKALNGFNIKT
ncbi:MAG TPA: nucleoside triphosphate pyrophosphatase [Patescibacteria group bacterium]|nr:nucleoside triphosphate pyrophosphatase [Patescibacteria group bacterium]